MKKKKYQFYVVYFSIFFLLLLSIIYMLFYKGWLVGTPFDDFIMSLRHQIGFGINHIRAQMGMLAGHSITYLGMFYVAFLGGFFFLTIPIDFFYLAAILNLNPLYILLLTLFGSSISYTLNYVLGLKFSNFSKKLISIKSFYKIKKIINRRGTTAILFFNIISIFSQQVTFVLGVFRYNKTRLFIYTFVGQFIRYVFYILVVFLSRDWIVSILQNK